MAKFTPESARAAAAKRHARKAAEPTPPARPDPTGDPSAFPQAVVVVPPAPAAPVAPEPATHPSPPAGAGDVAAPSDPAPATPFTPEIAEMLTRIAFDIAGAATGRPHIWKIEDEEIEHLTEPMAHQLARIPLVRAIGPDNTELVIVTVGMGVIVTKRLNAHADEVQQERQEKIRQLRTGERPRPREVEPPATASSSVESGAESSAAALTGFKGI